MDCKEFMLRMDAMLDGELKHGELARMQIHMQTCGECKAAYEDALQTLARCSELADSDEPRELFAALMGAVRAEAAARPARKWYAGGRVWGIAGAAACVVIVAAIALSSGVKAPGARPSGTSEPFIADSIGYIGGAAGDGTAASPPGTVVEGAKDLTGIQADMGFQMEEQMDEPIEESAMIADTNASAFLSYSADTDRTEGGDSALYGQKIITNGYLSMESVAFDEDVGQIESVIASYGGYMQNTSVSGRPLSDVNQYGRSSNYTARVPSEHYKSVVEALKQYGVVTGYSEYADDITSSYYDVKARLDAYQAQYDKISALLAQAETLDEVLKIEEELSRLQYQIDSNTGMLTYWDNRVSYSTLDVYVQEVRNPSVVQKVDPTLGERIRDGFVAGINAMVAFFENALVWLASSAIVLALIAIAAVVAALFIRRAVVKKRKRVVA